MREYLLARKDFHPLKRSLKSENSEKKKRSQIKPYIYISNNQSNKTKSKKETRGRRKINER